MTNPERDPDEIVCRSATSADGVEIMTPRDVPLGGPRAMTVRRTLPQRQRSLIGAWCFVDHYGPDDVAVTGGMAVAPHPHTGLQTVSWLFTGEVEHRDSAGTHAMVRPGEVNLMTAGRGISHSENSTPGTTTLHGAQLWVALPDHARFVEPGFEHYAPDPVAGPGWEARVFLGSLLGSTSPVATHTPLLGAEILLEAGSTLDIDVDDTFEHGLLVDAGLVTLSPITLDPVTLAPGGPSLGSAQATPAAEVKPGELAYTAPGCTRLRIAAHQRARLLLLGGPPFGESIVMWWNFVGRDHDEIVAYRAEWQEQISRGGEVVEDGQQVRAGRFGVVVGDHDRPIPAPALPNARLKERR